MNLGMYILAEKKGREGRKTGNSCFVRTNSAPDLSFLFPVFNQYIVFFSYIYRDKPIN